MSAPVETWADAEVRDTHWALKWRLFTSRPLPGDWPAYVALIAELDRRGLEPIS